MGAKGKPLPKELRERISQILRERHLETLRQRAVGDEPTHKRCSRCKKVKLVSEFSRRKHKLKSGVIAISPRPACKKCESIAAQKWKAEKIAEGTWHEYQRRKEKGRDKDRHREYQREWAAAKRRQNGDPAVGPRYKGKAERRLSAAPLARFLGELGEPPGIISSLSGVPERRLYAITHGEQKGVTLRVVDAILTAVGFPDDLHRLYPEECLPHGYSILDPKGLLREDGEVV